MDNYKIILSKIHEALKLKALKRKGDSFYYAYNNNTGVINFQKRRIGNVIAFTINLGVHIGQLKVFDHVGKVPPAVDDLHWRMRIGFLLPENKDIWWELDDNTQISKLSDEIINVLVEIVIPKISLMLSEEYLLEFWLNGGNFDGLSDPQRQLYLIALMKMHGKGSVEAEVSKLISLSKGKPFYESMMGKLARIGISPQ